MAFAEGTSVSPERTRAEIEGLLGKYKAEAFATAKDARRAVIEFAVGGRRMRFTLWMPNPKDKKFTAHTRYTWKSAPETQQAQRYEAEVRRLWRALLLSIKAKLEAAASGIESLEEAFMAQIVMPNGRTVGEEAAPMIARAYETGKMQPLLGMGDGQ